MMGTIGKSDEPASAGEVAAQAGRGPMVDWETLERMSLEELLYYVLVGDGRRLVSDKR
jgi:hypothetical protein